jgi:hypothetical protein
MLLNGWKEIAAYLKTSVRTVQRWQLSGLPIVRPGNGARGSVIAYSEQVDRWLLSRGKDRLRVRSNGTARERLLLLKNLERAHLLAVQLGEVRDRMQSQLRDLCFAVSAMGNRPSIDALPTLALPLPKRTIRDEVPD